MLRIISVLVCITCSAAGEVKPNFPGTCFYLTVSGDTLAKECRCKKYQRKAEREYRRLLRDNKLSQSLRTKENEISAQAHCRHKHFNFKKGKKQGKKVNTPTRKKSRQFGWFRKDIAACFKS